MILVAGGVIVLIVSNVLGQGGHEGGTRRAKANDNTLITQPFKDVFLAGMSGRPTLGTASATCWARGGICVEISQCPSLQMDVGVAGCSWGYKVCCKVHTLGSPTVGVLRRYAVPVINNLDELGPSLEIIALRNSMLLSTWHTKKPETDDVHLDDLLN